MEGLINPSIIISRATNVKNNHMYFQLLKNAFVIL